jgi:ring-1,2-phenylacetyl-CoA epoxidase subunit PaaC
MTALETFLLSLADTHLILSHRNSEWCGHGPVLEQDIALTNISLDELGQARLYYQHAAALMGNNTTEDSLAYHRNESDFRNWLLVELPKNNWGFTVLRQFYCSIFFLHFQEWMVANTKYQPLKEIAAKSLKEIQYHVRWSTDWVIRLGDGTEKSNAIMQQAVNEIEPYINELFTATNFEKELQQQGILPNLEIIKNACQMQISNVLHQAQLMSPITVTSMYGGKEANHSNYLIDLLAEMQSIQRQFPNMQW